MLEQHLAPALDVQTQEDATTHPMVLARHLSQLIHSDSMRQAAMARRSANRPRVLLCDCLIEPVSGRTGRQPLMSQ